MMKPRMMHFRNRAGPLSACLVFTFTGLAIAQADSHRVELPVGSVIPVRLNQKLSSKTARVGDRVNVVVRYGNDDSGIPEGSRVDCRISEAVRASRGKPGVLDIDFRKLVMRDGQTIDLNGSMVSLDTKSVRRTDSGKLVATTDNSNDRLKWVGVGAGAGLLVSVLTKGNSLLDTILGAGAGYLYNEFGNKPKLGDVNLKSGTEFGIRIDRRISFDTNRSDNFFSPNGEPYDASRNDDRRTSYDSANSITIIVDGRQMYFGSAGPFMRGNQVMVPLEAVSREAKFDYSYDAERRIIRSQNGALRLNIGSRYATLNNRQHSMPAAAEMRNGTLYVPRQFIDLATDHASNWDADARTLVLTTHRTRYSPISF